MKCKPGSHHVKEHYRVSKDGVKHTVKEHCRINAKSKSKVLYASNLDYLFENKNRSYQKLNKIKGYKDNGQYDEMIQFWLDYWKSLGVIKFKVDPMFIKAIIAVESSFRESIITTIAGSSATGLMQITKSTMKWLAGKPQADGHIQIRRNEVDITQEEAQIANYNIAIGTRWLAFKIKKSKYKNEARNSQKLHGGIKFYYGWNDDGQKYLEKVLKVYNANK